MIDLRPAVFTTMSAMTTTGGTVLTGIETLPRSVLLWRGLLQWIGGIGVILLAMILLPVLNIGGMQLPRKADFNTMDKILPRAKELAVGFGARYSLLTIGCWSRYRTGGQFRGPVRCGELGLCRPDAGGTTRASDGPCSLYLGFLAVPKPGCAIGAA